MAAAQSVMSLRLTMTVLPVMGLAAVVVVFGKKFKLTDEKMAEMKHEIYMSDDGCMWL